jgi:hypothetical protein
MTWLLLSNAFSEAPESVDSGRAHGTFDKELARTSPL